MGNKPQVKTNYRLLTRILASVVALILTFFFLKSVFKDNPETVTAERKYETFGDFVERKADGTYQLKPQRRQKLNNDVRRMREEAEQYVLTAKADGYYQCSHCPQGSFYLFKGEVVKVGITRQGEQGRYDQNFYRRMNVEYIVEYKGNLQTASEKEVIRIGNYPLTPENLARPDEPEGGILRYKLARPPLNTGDN